MAGSMTLAASPDDLDVVHALSAFENKCAILANEQPPPETTDIKLATGVRGSLAGSRSTTAAAACDEPNSNPRATAMLRSATMPDLLQGSGDEGPAPGTQGMKELFFVRQNSINFNASYGTPAREVRDTLQRNLLTLI